MNKKIFYLLLSLVTLTSCLQEGKEVKVDVEYDPERKCYQVQIYNLYNYDVYYQGCGSKEYMDSIIPIKKEEAINIIEGETELKRNYQ